MTGTANLNISVPEEILSRLDDLATQTAQSRSAVAVRALAASVEDEDWKLKASQAGLDDVAAGGVVSHEKVDAWLASWGDENELPAPLMM